MKVSKRVKNTPGIDLSPMLDVIFQLILFFLVSTTFASLPGINVNLPVSSTAQSSDASGITITIQDNGNLWFNDEKSSMELLDSQLASVDVGDMSKEEYPVMISADDLVTNGQIVQIFDALRRNGYSAVSLRTTSENK